MPDASNIIKFVLLQEIVNCVKVFIPFTKRAVLPFWKNKQSFGFGSCVKKIDCILVQDHAVFPSMDSRHVMSGAFVSAGRSTLPTRKRLFKASSTKSPSATSSLSSEASKCESNKCGRMFAAFEPGNQGVYY
jgi:hypothetical protein